MGIEQEPQAPIEQEPIEKEPKADPFLEFQKEIQRLKEEEEKEGSTVHFEKVNPTELTPEDFDIWQRLQTNQLSREEFESWRTDILTLMEKGMNDQTTSRKSFAEFVANEMTKRMLKGDLR